MPFSAACSLPFLASISRVCYRKVLLSIFPKELLPISTVLLFPHQHTIYIYIHLHYHQTVTITTTITVIMSTMAIIITIIMS